MKSRIRRALFHKLLFCLAIAASGLLCTSRCFGQKHGQELIDSLLKKLTQAQEDTNKVKLLNALSVNYQLVDPNEGIKYGQQELELAKKLPWKNGMAMANRSIGVNYDYKNDYPNALQYFAAAEKIFEELQDQQGMATITSNIGSIYHSQSNYAKALEYFFKALKIHEGLGNKLRIAILTGNIALVYSDQSDYAKALEYDFKALKISEEIGDKQGIASVSGNMGIVYYNQKDYNKALEYYFKALKQNEELGNKRSISIFTGNVGNVYSDQNNYQKALEYYHKALKMCEDLDDKQGVAIAAINISEVYIKQKNYKMAIGYCQDAVKMSGLINDRHSVAAGLYAMGNAYLALVKDTVLATGQSGVELEIPEKKQDLDVLIPAGKAARLHNAILYLRSALDTAKKIQTPDIVQSSYEALAEAYKLNGDYRNAMECYQNYVAIKDSLFSKESNEKIMKMGMQNEYDRKALEVRKAAELKLQRQRTYTRIGIAGVILLLGFSFFIIHERRKSEQERKKSDSLLLNILPNEVANELKINGRAAARHFNNVTVLFTDFVNFTQASEKMGPQALIDELHTCFKEFDEITARYSIEKIKTIGDAYLCVAGLPLPDANHATNIVNAAIEINKFMTDRHAKLGDKTFEIRIGIHSGSVVAGIVGVKKFAYDIWGDTVNTAARMQQSGEAGKINISQTTYDLVKNSFNCTYRGEIDVKNKGLMNMYFVA